MEKIELQKLITKYYFLELNDSIINNIIIQKEFKTYEQVDLYLQKLLILILNNKLVEFEFINIKREVLISNYINKELKYTNSYIENINQIKKLYIFYDLIENKKEILELNKKLLNINSLLKKIFKNIYQNYYKINICDDYFLILLDSYLNNNNQVLNTDVDKERYNLLLKAKNGDLHAYHKFIESNMKLVISIIKYYQMCHNFDDLKQCGYIGLIEAYNKFNLGLGYSFSTYAEYWIKREIFDYIHDDRLIKYPKNNYPLLKKIKEAIDELSINNIPITDKNISKKTGISIKKISIIRKTPINVESLDSPTIDGEEETSLINLIKDDFDLEENYINIDTKEQIIKILEQMVKNEILTERDKIILLMHTGFINNKVYKYEEIGKIYHITRQRVDQIYKSALSKIKKSKYFKILANYLTDEELKNKIINKRKSS